MTRKLRRVGLAVVSAAAGLIALTMSISPAPAATPEAVDAAVKKAIAAIYKEESGGTWEKNHTPPGADADHDSVNGAQWGGNTGAAVYALLSAGEKADDPRMVSAIEFLRKAPYVGVYATAVRAQVWPLLPKSRENLDAAKRDAQLLLKSVRMKGEQKGMWYYFLNKPDDERGDHSASQFAVLGVYACEEAGVEIPDNFWKIEDQVWREHQQSDGGWAYVFNDKGAWGKSSLSMTAAGMATLFLTQDELHRGSANCIGNARDEVIQKGFDEVARLFPPDGHFSNNVEGRLFTSGAGNRATYLLFALQRLGVYSGYRYFCNVDWFQAGADYLIREQRPNGTWGDEPWETSLGLLFLARARAPIAFNKLNYTVAGQNPPPPWDQRPRDVANLCHWMSRERESNVNFQIVDTGSDPLDWTDAPILILTGSEELKLTPEQIDKLRKFVNAGGMIVGSADCSSPKFSASLRKIGNAMFPDDEFLELPADHVLYTNENYKRKHWHAKVTVQGITNGDRVLMVIVPDADLGKAWQMQSSSTKAEQFELADDLYSYQTNDGGARFRGDTIVTKPDPAIHATRTLRVARLQYAGMWDPEPGGWIRFAAELHNRAKTDVQTTAIKLGDGKLDSNSFEIAHLTGTFGFTLKDASRNEIKKFVDGGGVLIVDSAGGSAAFSTAAETELGTIFPDTPLADLPDDSPLLKTPLDATKVSYRKFARSVVGNSTSPRIKTITRNGRIAVIYSPMDLSVGLVGTGVDGIAGYAPASATAVMADLVCSAGKK